jgi:hypothetical protein
LALKAGQQQPAKPALLIFMETALEDFVKVAYNYEKKNPTLRVA